LSHPYCWTDLLNPAEAKEKILKALSARRVVERGWLTALLGLYLAKRKEAKVRLKHIGDVVLERKTSGPCEAYVSYY